MTNQSADTAFDKRDYVAAARLYGPMAPADLHAAYRLGLCHFRLKDFAAALRAFRAAIDYHPEDARSWYYLGVCAERTGDTAAAIPAYRMALRLDPTLSQAREKLLALDPGAALPSDGLAQSSSGTAQLSEPVAPPHSEFARENATQPQNAPEPIPDDDTGHPGELLHVSRRRRIGSFTSHFILLGSPIIVFFLNFPLVFFSGGVLGLHLGFILNLAILIWVFVLAEVILRSYLTRVSIYERRIDIADGILFRRQRSVWIFRVQDLQYRRNPITLLTRNAAIRLETENGRVDLLGLTPPKGSSAVVYANDLFDELRIAVRNQRGKIKRIFA